LLDILYNKEYLIMWMCRKYPLHKLGNWAITDSFAQHTVQKLKNM